MVSRTLDRVLALPVFRLGYRGFVVVAAGVVFGLDLRLSGLIFRCQCCVK